MHETRFLLITSFLVVMIGAPAVMSVVRDPSAGSASSSQSTGRQPASVATSKATARPTVISHRNAIHSRSVVMDYDCKKQMPDLEVDGTLLRLKGQDSSCLSEDWTDISITNQSNGFTASVIFLKKGFTTDFIDLKEGENNLEIQAKDSKGQAVSKKITVKRRSIASVEE